MSRIRGELPVDLVSVIFLKLEVKHLLRCKLISKSICNLIMSTTFAYKHLHHSQTRKNNGGKNIVYAVHKFHLPPDTNNAVHLLSPESEVQLPPLARSADFYLVGSCNGLLLIRLLYFKDLRYHMMLFNPTTREYRMLPAVPFSTVQCDLGSYDGFGLGYDALSSDYKVVRIPHCSPRNKPFVVEVWTSRTNKWTEIDFVLPKLSSDQGYEITSDSTGLFISGNLYWAVRPFNHHRLGSNDVEILFSFSLADYTCRQITVSDVTAQYHSPMKHFMEYRGSPAMVVHEFNPLEETEYDIWVVEDTAGDMTWAKLFSIGPFPRYVSPTRVSVNGNFLMTDSNKVSTDRFFLYDPHTEEEKQLQRESSVKNYSCMLWNLDESLVSVY